ncbi:MAG: divalent cation tolerance protein CutA [Candidatus Dormibacteraeota bacterium]|nr:divalent cation tolerance protein CutA [Candidatus Dormibacteraeota bacterium]
MSEPAILLMVTAATRDEAENLGEGLLTAGLATRGSVIPVIHSFWMDQDRLERGHEALLLVTTSKGDSSAAVAFLREHHSFQEPHIVSLPLA